MGMPKASRSELDERQDLQLALGIERRQRLIHEKELGRGEQGPADGDTLLLAAGQTRRPPVEEMGDAERLDHRIEGYPAGALRQEPAAEDEILAHGQMGKQAGILKHEADPATVRRHEDAGYRIHQRAAAKHDPAAVRPGKPGDQVDGHGLAGAGPPEQSGDAGLVLESDIEIEGAERERHIDADPGWGRGVHELRLAASPPTVQAAA